MATFAFDQLLDLTADGGAHSIARVDQLEPSAGPGTPINAAKYSRPKGGGKGSINNYAVRNIDNKPLTTAVLLSKQGLLNHIEKAIVTAPDTSALHQLPRIGASYEITQDDGSVRKTVVTNLDLSHRSLDSHILFGTDPATDKSAAQHPVIVALRKTSITNHRAFLENAPTDLLLGMWDSFYKASVQTRVPSALTGEIIGVLADQNQTYKNAPRHGAAKTDPLGAAFAEFDKATLAEMTELRTGWPVSKNNKAKEKASEVGLGGIVVSPVEADGAVDRIAVTEIRQTWSLSINALRHLHFGFTGSTPAEAAKKENIARAALVAVALTAQAYAEQDTYLRAGTDLITTDSTDYRVRAFRTEDQIITLPTISEAEALLTEAISALSEAGVDWSGQRLIFTGNPKVRPIDGDAEAADDDK